DVAPIFIKRYETLWEWGFGEDAKRCCEASLVENKIAIEFLGKEGEQLKSHTPFSLYDFSDFMGQDTPDPWRALLRVIDMGFYTEMYRRYDGDELDRYLTTVKSDRELLEGWLRWYRWEEKRFKELQEHRRILLNDDNL
ncbi:MAG: hypothetical protein JRJ69_03990, partial [Deltaproteobacteria bacterium]|nr:hypothetical protein [Deltaproteobacteria bacterium]